MNRSDSAPTSSAPISTSNDPPAENPVQASDPPAAPTAPAPTITELFVAFAKISLSGFGGVLAWARRMMVEERKWMTSEQFNEVYALCSFLPGGNIINFSVIIGGRFRGPLGSVAALAGLLGPPMVLILIIGAIYAHYGDLPVLRRALTGVAAAAAGLMLATVAKMVQPLFRNRAAVGLAIALATFLAIAVMQLAAAVRAARDRAGQHRLCLEPVMKNGGGVLLTLAAFFAATSLFTIGGANSAVPEMHRYAVDVQHWLTDREFSTTFALAQLTPGPNIIIVTLIGYHVAGVIGGLVTTLAMCGPTCVFAYFVGRASDRFKGATWHDALSRGLVPVTLGLLASSATVIATTSGYGWLAVVITVGTAITAFFVRVHPLMGLRRRRGARRRRAGVTVHSRSSAQFALHLPELRSPLI